MSIVRQLSEKKPKGSSGYMEMFLQFEAGRGLAETSIKIRRNILKLLLAHCADLTDEKALKQTVAALLAGKNQSYYNKILTVLRQFFTFLIDEHVITTNPASKFHYRRNTTRIVKHPEEDVRRLLNAIDKTTFSGLRDYAFCLLMLDTGIRPSEAIQLRIEDVNFIDKQVRVRAEYAKTRVERYLPISIQTVHVLQKIIAARPEDWRQDLPVLCTYEGKHLQTVSIRKRFERYSLQIGTKITPYHLRHTFALYFIRNGGDAFALQRIMGHAQMDMTRVYVNLATEDIAEKHQQATPIRNFVAASRVRKVKK